MKILISYIVFISLTITGLFAQTEYIPLDLNGFNSNCVVDKLSNLSGASSIDANGWAFYSSAIQENGSMPDTDKPLTTSTGITYNLMPYGNNNTFLLSPSGASSLDLTLSAPAKTSEIWLLGTSANGSNTINVKIHYKDGSSSSVSLEYPDWYQSSSDGVAVFGLGRINLNSTNQANIDGQYNFSLFERIVPVDSTKTVTSMTILPQSGSGYVAIFAASAFDVTTQRSDNYNFYLISDSHLDTQWNWELKQTIGEYIPNTLDQNFALFEKYPHFQFNFEGAIHYMWMKEYYPEKWEKLKQYVDQGRWHISGGSINANDVMVPSAESIIRNFLYGQTFYKREFGRKGGNDVMLPDCFGFPYSLPTLAQHAGATSFHTAKLAWGSAYDYNSLFTFGRWAGVDGSEILALLKPGAYDSHEEFRKNLSYDGSILNQCIANEKNLGVPATFRYVGPRSDHDGGLDDETASWLEQSITSNGPVKVNLTPPDTLFGRITDEQRANLPVWDNELPMRTHGVGCYTSQAILKYWNRKNELLAGSTEKIAVVSNWLGTLKYPTSEIEKAWVRILWHQFHDDLTGTSIPKAYTYTYNDAVLNQLTLSKTLINSVGALSRKLNTNVEGIPLVVFNPLSISRTDLVEASLKTDLKPTSLLIIAPDGQTVESQILNFDENTGELKFLFVADVPSMGYATYSIRTDNIAQTTNESLKASNNSLENSVFKITLDSKGDVSSIYDKGLQRELLSAPIRLALLSDVSTSWPAWEITAETDQTEPYAYVDQNVNISIAENGPLRVSLKVTRSKNGSEYVQYIRLKAQTSPDRIDFANEIDWQTKGTLLKAVFPLAASNDSAAFDLSIGAIDRPNSTSNLYEVAGHQWADLTNNDHSYGISILNDCKYGWDKPSDNTLRLSLIHTPVVDGGYTYQSYQDLGLNKFTFSFFRHPEKWNETTQWEGEKLNQPLLAFQATKHDGILGKSFGFADLNTEKVAIKALKKAENSDDIIVRVYELTGENQQDVTIKFASKIISAREVNGIEENMGTATYTDSTLMFDIGRFQPKTFALKLASPDQGKDSLPVSNPVALLYNIDVMSYDTDRTDGSFGESGLSYPAELIGDTLMSDGIGFKMGPRGDGQLNAIRCEGQTIQLDNNKGTNKKLYILAASTKSPNITADFKIDDLTYPLEIGYFAGSVGQWTTEFAQGYYRNENIAFTATHRHNQSTKENEPYNFLYLFKYVVPVGENAQTLMLPDDPNVIVFAATLSDNANDDIIPATAISNLPAFTDIENAVDEEETCNPQITPAKVSVSGQTDESESGSMATDNDPFTKWCDNSSSQKWLELDFTQEMSICQWQAIHAAVESEDMITSGFRLQKYFNGIWIDVDVVDGNSANKTNRTVDPFNASRVRLKIDQTEQNSNNASRIYEFKVFGTEKTTGIGTSPSSLKFKIYPNPVGQDRLITIDTNYSGTLQIYSIQGVLLFNEEISGPKTVKINMLNEGSYIARLLTAKGILSQMLIIQ